MKSSNNERGSALIIELLVLAIVLIVAGFAVYQYSRHQSLPTSATNVSASPTPVISWKTCANSYEGVRFSYPENWKLTQGNPGPCGASTILPAGEGYSILLSPAAPNNTLYELRYTSNAPVGDRPAPGTPQAGDPQLITSVAPLFAAGTSNPYYLISYRDTCCGTQAPSDKISFFAITDQKYAVGETFYGAPFITSRKHIGEAFTIEVRLTKAPSGTQNIENITPDEFKANPAYADLMKVLRSVSY